MLYLVEWEHPERGTTCEEVLEAPAPRRGRLPAELWQYLAAWVVPASAETFTVATYRPRLWRVADGPNRAAGAVAVFVGEYRRAVGERLAATVREDGPDRPAGERAGYVELPAPAGSYPAEGGGS